MSTPTIHTHGRITDVRKAIKQAAKAGGSYHVQVDMRPTSAQDAENLLRMARGEKFGMRSIGYTYRESLGWYGAGYVPDHAYEARMTAWAATFTTHEEKAA
jgi:hypothetical protein